VPDPPNATIAALFDELADLYELDGAVVHRGARLPQRGQGRPRGAALGGRHDACGTVTELPGIGRTLEEKLRALLDTGKIPLARAAARQFPPGLVEMTHLPGLGPSGRAACSTSSASTRWRRSRRPPRPSACATCGASAQKFEEAVLAAFAAGRGDPDARPKMLLNRALQMADGIVEALRAHPASDRVEIAGSARRLADSVKDLDLIADGDGPAGAPEGFRRPRRHRVVRLAGRQRRARAAPHRPERRPARRGARPVRQPAAALHRLQGAQHGAPRGGRAPRAARLGVRPDGRRQRATHAAPTEEEVYALLGLPWIPPELREDRGELQLRSADEVPELVEVGDLRGDLHCHTVASDGRHTSRRWRARRRSAGSSTWRSPTTRPRTASATTSRPTTCARRSRRARAQRALRRASSCSIGTETNIGSDGGPDYDDDLLAELDWVDRSVHTSFGDGREDDRPAWSPRSSTR
jgi:DNA polymerase (family 10)